MAYELRFEDLLLYDAGVTVPITIRLQQDFVRFDAKLDTGATASLSAHTASNWD